MSFLEFVPDWLLVHGPAFLMALPLIMAAITAILPNKRVAWASTFIVTVILTLTAFAIALYNAEVGTCLLYTSPSPRDLSTSRMPSSA